MYKKNKNKKISEAIINKKVVDQLNGDNILSDTVYIITLLAPLLIFCHYPQNQWGTTQYIHHEALNISKILTWSSLGSCYTNSPAMKSLKEFSQLSSSSKRICSWNFLWIASLRKYMRSMQMSPKVRPLISVLSSNNVEKFNNKSIHLSLLAIYANDATLYEQNLGK